MSDHVDFTIRNQITRGKVVQTVVGGRTFIQITGMEGVVQQVIELLLPPGYSANPVSQSDILLLQVMGSGDHVVALGGDMLGNAIADLAPGEFGLSNGTQKVIFRTDHIELVSPTYILATTPQLRVTGEIIQGYGTGDTTTLGTHTHRPGTGGNTGTPNNNT